MPDDPGEIVFEVGVDWAACHASGLEAVVAANREVMSLGERITTALDFAYAPPENVGRISILFVAGHHAAFTANALRHVEVKPVLLARAGRGQSVTGWSCTAERPRRRLVDSGGWEECDLGFLHSLDQGKFHKAPFAQMRGVAKSYTTAMQLSKPGRAPLSFVT